jgi:hypothetical protein
MLMTREKKPKHLRLTPLPQEARERLAKLTALIGEQTENNPQRLLYLEPSASTSEEPLIDELTEKMTSAFRQATEGERWRGYHTCACGVNSDNCDYILPSGHETNSLAIHYLALHREEVPLEQLEIVASFDYGLEEPAFAELNIPEPTK